ncbi:hypothetical protein AgCh_031276 [Apium graveolens]
MHPSMNIVLKSGKRYLEQWQKSQRRSSQALVHSKFVGDGAESWVKPQSDNIKVTVDAAIFREQATFGMGMIARDSNGELIQAKSMLKGATGSSEFGREDGHERSVKLD